LLIVLPFMAQGCLRRRYASRVCISIVSLSNSQHGVFIFFDISSGLLFSPAPAAHLRAVKPVPVVIAAAPCGPALPIAVSPVQLAAIIARNTLRF
jgi:hypothetical protein